MRTCCIALLLAAGPTIAGATEDAAGERAAAPAAALGPRGRPSPGCDGACATPRGLVLEFHSDYGLERLFEIQYMNERRSSMNLNDGFTLALGWSFLPLASGRLATRAAVGFKLDMVRASNGSALFTAVPVDLMEAAYVGPFRLGAGASLLLWPRLRGDGFLEQATSRFSAAPGAALEAEWILAARSRTGIGVRTSWYRFSWNGVSRWAPSVGLVVRADFDLTR